MEPLTAPWAASKIANTLTFLYGSRQAMIESLAWPILVVLGLVIFIALVVRLTAKRN